jgi:hypothetical protein
MPKDVIYSNTSSFSFSYQTLGGRGEGKKGGKEKGD